MVFKFKSKISQKKVSDTAKKTAKDREKRQLEAIRYLKWCDKHKSREDICIVCGDFMPDCLTWHHPEGKKKNPNFKVILCGSCHSVFHKKGGLKELKERRKRYYKYNLKINLRTDDLHI